jgi:hypothetical protein
MKIIFLLLSIVGSTAYAQALQPYEIVQVRKQLTPNGVVLIAWKIDRVHNNVYRCRAEYNAVPLAGHDTFSGRCGLAKFAPAADVRKSAVSTIYDTAADNTSGYGLWLVDQTSGAVQLCLMDAPSYACITLQDIS